MVIQHKRARESLSLLISYSPAYWSAYEKIMQDRKALETSNFNTPFWADAYNRRAIRDGNPLRACAICGRLHQLPMCEAQEISSENVPIFGQKTKVPVSQWESAFKFT